MLNSRIKKAFLFWGGLIVILTGVKYTIQYGIKKSTYSWYNKVNLIMQQKADPEIAIFGSSVSEVGMHSNIIDSITKKSTFNFSIDGTRFQQLDGYIRNYISYARNCKAIILAETYFTFTPVDKVTQVDRFMPYMSNDLIFQSHYSIQPDLALKLSYVPFYDFIVAKYPYYNASVRGLLGNSLQDTLKGYTPKYKTWEPGVDSINRNSKPFRVALDQEIVKKYAALVDAIRKENIKVIILLPPFYVEGMKLITNFDELKNTFAGMANNETVFFRDYSLSEWSYDKKWFYNNSHLNNEGAQVFTAKLAYDIKNSIIQRK